MTKPMLLVSLMLFSASSALGDDLARAGVATAAPQAAAAPAMPNAPAMPAPAEPARAPKTTLAGIGRHVTRTVTALMRQLAESRIPPQPRSDLNERLLAVQAQVSAAIQAGQAPAGGDVEAFSARLGHDLDAIAAAIDAASRRSL